MRIGIDYTAAVRQGAGIGRYTRGLVAALAERDHENRYVVFSAGADAPGTAWPANFRRRALPLTDRHLAIMWQRLRLPLPVECFTGRLDLFHSPDFVLPPVWRARTVLTVHDLSFMHYPECSSPPLLRYLMAAVPRSVLGRTPSWRIPRAPGATSSSCWVCRRSRCSSSIPARSRALPPARPTTPRPPPCWHAMAFSDPTFSRWARCSHARITCGSSRPTPPCARNNGCLRNWSSWAAAAGLRRDHAAIERPRGAPEALCGLCCRRRSAGALPGRRPVRFPSLYEGFGIPSGGPGLWQAGGGRMPPPCPRPPEIPPCWWTLSTWRGGRRHGAFARRQHPARHTARPRIRPGAPLSLGRSGGAIIGRVRYSSQEGRLR